jgi:hypothetical protein
VFWAYICVVVLPVYFFKVEITYKQSLRFFKGNYDEINRLLANTDWDLELAQGDIDELWNRFAYKISSTYKDNIPVSLQYLIFFHSLRFLIKEFSVTSFIHGVLNFFVIDLLTGILSLYVLDIL